MKAWFEGEGALACDLDAVRSAVGHPSRFFVGVVARMPGISEAEIVEEAEGSVTIRTNEGLMKRTSLAVQDGASLRIDFDEVYEAGPVTVSSHYSQEFTASEDGVQHRLVITGVEAPGLLGLAYRWLGSKNIGRAVLEAHRQFFTAPRD